MLKVSHLRAANTMRNVLLGLALSSTLPVTMAQCHMILLYNGKITTMASSPIAASWILVDGERIARVGSGPLPALPAACVRKVNLQGRRVIPGLIDSHNHIVVVSLRPGYDVRLDSATSVSDVAGLLRTRADAVPPAAWITAVGGWSPEQLAERRMPTIQELDATGQGHPIYLQIGFDGPAVTNTAGKAFFESHGVPVGADGSIAANAPTLAAFKAIKALQTFQDKKRGAMDAMNFAASLGLTMSDDKGGTWPTDMNVEKGAADLADRTNGLNPFTDYDGFLTLEREGRMPMRLRIFFYMQDVQAALPLLRSRLDNQFPDFGSNWLKVSGIGERIYSGPFPFTAKSSPEVYTEAAKMVARKGWAHDEHAGGLADEKEFTAVWEKVNAEVPLAPLRWCLAHVPGIDSETLLRLKALGVGVSAAGSRYTATTPPRIGVRDVSPLRLLVDSGIQVGYGSDGGTVSALNPWLHLYYMVTGKNSAGQTVGNGQTLTRMEALRLYTANQPWFTHDEANLGTLEPGKLADIVVLSEDYLDPSQVPVEHIKLIKSILTMVGGEIVYQKNPVVQ